MQIVRGLQSFPPDGRASAVALGAFDGIHLGHRAILARAVALARQHGLAAVACTFDRHPLEVLQPERAPLPITTLEERLELIAAIGVDATLVLPFTADLARVEPEAFVADVLGRRLSAREVVVGFNHRFGRGARGDAALLGELSGAGGFRVHVMPPLQVDSVPVSSSEIRIALQVGDVQRAARFLGRPYSVAGEVVAGDGRGRTLGFPTANVKADRPVLVARGVYSAGAEVDGRAWRAVVNVGVRPTFGDNALAVEAHVLDFSGNLYGRRVTLRFVARIRDELKFSSVDALRGQIARDVAAARAGG